MSKEQEDYFKSIVKGRYTNEIIELYKNKFGIVLTPNNVKYYKRKFRLTSGMDTTFKKNVRPHNYLPIGSEFTNDKGYVEIKVSDPNTWELKHRYLYKKYKGQIPNNHCVIFLNGDKKDFDLDNLELVHSTVKLIMKNLHLFSSDKEITKTGILVATVIAKTHNLDVLINN